MDPTQGFVINYTPKKEKRISFVSNEDFQDSFKE